MKKCSVDGPWVIGVQCSLEGHIATYTVKRYGLGCLLQLQYLGVCARAAGLLVQSKGVQGVRILKILKLDAHIVDDVKTPH